MHTAAVSQSVAYIQYTYITLCLTGRLTSHCHWLASCSAYQYCTAAIHPHSITLLDRSNA